MYDFEYCRPTSLDQASRLLKEHGDAKLLAGGMTLIPTLKLRLARLTHVIDLAPLKELDGIQCTADSVILGAMTSHAEVARSPEVRSAIPALAELAAGIGDPHVRHRGTIGGSIANNDPAADYPAALLGLGAVIRTNRRTIAADDFFTGMFETALELGEIVVSVSIPIPRRAAYLKFRNPASRYALVGVFAAETAAGNRIAVTGAAPCVFRQAEMEQAVAGAWNASALAELSHRPEGLLADIHGTAEYRAHLVGVLARRAAASMN